MTTPFIEDNDQTRTRREHLEKIRELVGNVYPNKFSRTNVAESREGEDTITAIVTRETLGRLGGGEHFEEAFAALAAKVKAGERPTPEDLAPVNEALNKHTVRISGRIATPPRVMGKAAFVHLSDGNERLQIYVRKQDAVAISNDSGQPVEEPESGWSLFQFLDHGDFLGVEGFLFVTKSGELSVHVHQLQFLSKALLPMPDKMHGINDPEIRQRQRYADLIASSLKIEKDDEHAEDAARELTTREVFERRSKLITQLRRYLDDHGYIEVETPMLTPIASGAAARPFKTHHNALDIDLYARIAPELYLKRLLVGGFERVYELNRNFRNEGISTRHNPEFTMLEFYTAYKDVNWMMDFCEEMLRTTIQKVTRGTSFQFGNEKIDFSHFERLTMKEAIAEYAPLLFPALKEDTFNIEGLNDARRVYELVVLLEAYNDQSINEMIEAGKQVDIDKLWKQALASSSVSDVNLGEIETANRIQFLFEKLAEYMLRQPTFITDFPKPVSPLSKASPEDPTVAERFELYVAGMEVANGFSELNDPEEQYERFEEQARQRERGDEEAMQMDRDYVRALSYGMPPAAGIGIGVDRLTMLLTNRRSIRDVILFPHMRPQSQGEKGAEPTAAAASPSEDGPQK